MGDSMNMADRIDAVPETILIVDDNEINRAVLVNIFSSSFGIEEAENGEVALGKILQAPGKFCAVLLDVVMPVMDGMAVLEQLNAMGETKQIPVFLITAETANTTLEKAYSLGVMDVIAKPIVPYIVERRIQSVIELFRARKRLRSKVQAQRTELSQQARQIIELNVGMIEALSTAIEFRSGESGDHVRRIYDITKLMLTETDFGTGLSQETIEQISMAAIMHDVGKIAISDAILNKPGKLTKEEYTVMQTHTVQGAHLLDKIPQMRNHAAFPYAYDIARHHHERWDGKGYPDGLAGGEISIWAQVVSVADVYDALINHRVYKKAFAIDEAFRMIRDGECGVFGPRLLENFFSVEKQLRSMYESGKKE